MIDRAHTPPLPHHDYETLDLEVDDEEAIATERYPGPFPDALVAALEADARTAAMDEYDRPTLEMPVVPLVPDVPEAAVAAKPGKRKTKKRG
jgi:hypothetical protein